MFYIIYTSVLFYSNDGGSSTSEYCELPVKGAKAWRRVLREVDLMMICQVKPRPVRSWKAGMGGETLRLGFVAREA